MASTIRADHCQCHMGQLLSKFCFISWKTRGQTLEQPQLQEMEGWGKSQKGETLKKEDDYSIY